MAAAVEAVLRRHRFVTLAALFALTLLAWAWLVGGAGMAMGPQASLTPRSAAMASMTLGWGDAPLVFAMWWVMMVAMMLPAAAPTILLFARASAQNGTAATPPTGSFLAGYLAVWGGFSLAATLLQIVATRAGALSAKSMTLQSDIFIGGVLVAAGLYQLGPLKDKCLRHCRNPAQYLSAHFRPGRGGAWHMGLGHGAYCVGCCWMLMLLLFVGGIMNLAWIALLSLMIAAEKLLPFGRGVAIASGIGFLGFGGYILLG